VAQRHVDLYRRVLHSPVKSLSAWNKATYSAGGWYAYRTEPAVRRAVGPIFRRLAPSWAGARQRRARGHDGE
jgi:hypothetical protein